MQLTAFRAALPQHETLRAIVLMRSVALSCQLAGIIAAQFWLGIALQLAPLLSVMSLLALFNAWTWRRMRRMQPANNSELFAQLLIDILALSILLYFCGGATNPFVSFYLPVLAVAAALLPWRYAVTLACLSIAGYSLMTNYYVPLHMNDPERAISYHLAGMWVNFAASAGLITWFVARLSRTLRERDAQLASARERHLEHERLSALGIQAANAAHEMGTPLSTVAILAEDLVRDTAVNGALTPYREDFATIEAQITLCKLALQKMAGQGKSAPISAVPTPIAPWLMQFIEEWRLRHPAVRIEFLNSTADALVGDTIPLAQILTTLLDNAAQSAAEEARIQVIATRQDSRTVIEVVDDGPGIAPDLLPRLGYEQVESASNGLGIGLLLAFSTARRIGAGIRLTSRTVGGTSAALTIPAI